MGAGQAESRAGWSPGVAGVGRNGDLTQLGAVLASRKKETVQSGVVGQGRQGSSWIPQEGISDESHSGCLVDRQGHL